MPTQIFQINEPTFWHPDCAESIFMIPYILNALILTTCSYLLMYWNVIQRPFVNLPWTTPPIIGHYLITGGDWRAAVWGVISILIAMSVYYPLPKLPNGNDWQLKPWARPVSKVCIIELHSLPKLYLRLPR